MNKGCFLLLIIIRSLAAAHAGSINVSLQCKLCLATFHTTGQPELQPALNASQVVKDAYKELQDLRAALE